MLCVCTELHLLAARSLYTDVRVQGGAARRFFATIASNTRFSSMYGSMVRHLRYDIWTPTDRYLSFPVFCQALCYMDALHSLRIDGSCLLTAGLLSDLKRYGFVREGFLAATRLLRTAQGKPPNLRDPLSNLRHFHLSGDFALATLASNRHITQLIIDHQLCHYTFSEFCCSLYSSVSSVHLTSLSICFAPALDTIASLDALAEVLPHLLDFSFTKDGCKVFDAFARLVTPPLLFPDLRTLSIRTGLWTELSSAAGRRTVGVSVLGYLDTVSPGSRLYSISLGLSTFTFDCLSSRWTYVCVDENFFLSGGKVISVAISDSDDESDPGSYDYLV
ncbi:hypothetical protein C8R47DRAFT_1209154 [Mycena vitilis]|nr:hypothetical protein C8R47DRAFT_1209154 [Mycena vitilis]